VALGVLVETNWNIGGIGMLNEVSRLPIGSHDDGQDQGSDRSEFLQEYRERFVGASETENLPQRLNGFDGLFLPEETDRD